MDKLPDEQVILKVSTCNECKGIVRAAVKHLMDRKEKNNFAKEVVEYNLSVKEQFLIEYQRADAEWCKC